MSMSSSIKAPAYRTTTQSVCDNLQDTVQTSRHIADIFVAKQHDFLSPLELFKKGATVMRIGWSWQWVNEGSYNVPVRRISKNKYELILSST